MSEGTTNKPDFEYSNNNNNKFSSIIFHCIQIVLTDI